MTSKVTVADVDIPLVKNSVAINFSGGADSTLLLYILMKHLKQPIYIFTCASNHKGRSNAVTSPKVIEKCIQLTGNINIQHITFYVERQGQNLLDVPKRWIDALGIEHVYTAITANPPAEEIEKFTTEEYNSEIENRDPTKYREVFQGKYIIPFTNIDKKKIKEMYDELGITDILFPLTRSCEATKMGVEYYDHCGKCWWCNEREWAFGKL